MNSSQWKNEYVISSIIGKKLSNTCLMSKSLTLAFGHMRENFFPYKMFFENPQGKNSRVFA